MSILMTIKRLSLAATLAAVVALTASALAGAAQHRTAVAPIRACIIHNNADHPSIQSEISGFKYAAQFYPVKLSMFDPALSPQKQLSMIMDCVAQKYNVILVNAVDPAAVVPGLKAAAKAHIPVVMNNADTNAAGSKYTATFVTTDYTQQGIAVGQAIRATMPHGSQMVVITGIPGQTGVAERLNGAKSQLTGTGIKFVAIQSAAWQKDKALQVMQAFLTKYPKINGVYAEDDEMALGALQSIKAAGKTKQVKVFGVNGEKAVCKLIQQGAFGGTALQDSFLMGEDAIRAAWDITHNQIVPKVWTVPTIGLTKSNITKYQAQCW